MKLGSALALFVVFMTVVLSARFVVSHATHDTTQITPTRVFERTVSDGDGGSNTVYMLDAKTQSGEYVEYTIDDNFAFLHFSSGKLKNQLHDHIGETIVCETTGWRVPFLSMYENIHKCEF